MVNGEKMERDSALKDLTALENLTIPWMETRLQPSPLSPNSFAGVHVASQSHVAANELGGTGG
jgi:hypothetical protein